MSYSEILSDIRVYPLVDQREWGSQRNICSGAILDLAEIEIWDRRIETLGSRGLDLSLADENVMGELETAFALAANHPFNCAHVVPQSWFASKKKRKADFHHLFTCVPDCNNFRDNFATSISPRPWKLSVPTAGAVRVTQPITESSSPNSQEALSPRTHSIFSSVIPARFLATRKRCQLSASQRSNGGIRRSRWIAMSCSATLQSLLGKDVETPSPITPVGWTKSIFSKVSLASAWETGALAH